MNEPTKYLEEKIAYLERHVAEQDRVMLDFAQQLERMRREVRTMRDRVVATPAATVTADSVAEPRPPHY